MLAITSLYAGLIALVFLDLSRRVIVTRRSARVSMGDGGDKALQRRVRAQGNCAEYAPLGLLLLALCEVQGTPALVLHVFGLALLAGRVMHGYGFGGNDLNFRMRVPGMALTLLTLGVMAVGLVGHALWALMAG